MAVVIQHSVALPDFATENMGCLPKEAQPPELQEHLKSCWQNRAYDPQMNDSDLSLLWKRWLVQYSGPLFWARTCRPLSSGSVLLNCWVTTRSGLCVRPLHSTGLPTAIVKQGSS